MVLRRVVETRCGSTEAFERLFSVLGDDKKQKLHFLYTDEHTSDAVETVTYAIEAANISGPIFIKDADNDFTHAIVGGNYVTHTSIVKEKIRPSFNGLNGNSNNNNFLRPDLVDAVKKSYVSFLYDNVVSNVAYGTFLSSTFCCGGWGFLQAKEFVKAAKTLRGLLRTSGLKKEAGSEAGELRVMDVMWQLICEGHLFFGLEVEDYRDWGSEAAWMATIKASF